MGTGTLLFRADSGPRVGLGHLMRCIALADTWIRDGGEAVFLSTGDERGRVEAVGARFIAVAAGDAEETLVAAQGASAAWCVLDGYQFDAAFEQQLVDGGVKVLAIDDFGARGRYSAQLILDQNAAAREEDYAQRPASARLLLRSAYVLLRREFVGRVAEPAGQRVLVTLGGADEANVTARVLDAIAVLAHPELEVRAVVGPANPHREALRARATETVEIVVDPPSMADQLAWCSLAVTASGTTAWECAAMGVPSLQFFVAENQRRNTERLAALGVCRGLGAPGGWSVAALAQELAALLDTPPALHQMSLRGRALIDGLGAQRVCDALRSG